MAPGVKFFFYQSTDINNKDLYATAQLAKTYLYILLLQRYKTVLQVNSKFRYRWRSAC